jgi:hypothetical protein
MNGKKSFVFLSLPLLLAVFVFSQDLVELARKEKARRARLRSRSTVVLTNSDLRRVQPSSGVMSRTTQAPESEIPVTTIRSGQPASGEEAEQGDPAVRVTVEQSPAPIETIHEISPEEKWRRANNHVGTLNLRLAQLEQLYNNAETRDERARLQSQIDSTRRALEEARRKAAGLRKDLDNQRRK